MEALSPRHCVSSLSGRTRWPATVSSTTPLGDMMRKDIHALAIRSYARRALSITRNTPIYTTKET